VGGLVLSFIIFSFNISAVSPNDGRNCLPKHVANKEIN